MMKDKNAAVFIAYFMFILGFLGCDGITGKVTLKSLTITPVDFIMSIGTELQFTAVGRYSDGTDKDVTAETVWSSSDTAIVTLVGAGLAKATASDNDGTVEILASLKGYSTSTALTVVDIESQPDSYTNYPPSVQIVNYASDIHKVKIGRVSYSENLSCCGGGSSTGYFFVSEGANSIVVYGTTTSSEIKLGSLGPFLRGNHYTMDVGYLSNGLCTQLWQRGLAESDFIDDSAKVFINRTGYCEGRGV